MEIALSYVSLNLVIGVGKSGIYWISNIYITYKSTYFALDKRMLP